MMYADNFCTCTEKYEPEHVYVFTGKCVISGKEVSVPVKAKELYAYRQGVTIQDALKSLSADQREFLISGISGEEFDRITKEPEEAGDEFPKS